MSDEATGVLSRQIEKLQAENARRRASNKALKDDVDRLTRERDEARNQLGTVTGERDQLRTATTQAPAEKDERIAELEGQIRTTAHRAVFDKVARARGAKDDSLEALWGLSQHKADGDPDEGVITELVGRLATSYAPAFTTPTDAPPVKPSLPPGPGASRGSAALKGGPGTSSNREALTVRKSDTQSLDWMEKNGKALAEAHKNGTLVIVDE
jgi:uncharacterized small protein (DUF1192 family)